MKKLSLALAFGTGLTLSLAAPSTTQAAGAKTTIQTLATPELSASAFNAMFTPTNSPVLTSTVEFLNTPGAGTLRSQVFQGTGAAQGLYAYAYQLSVNNTTNDLGEPVHVDSASWQFNATPVATDFAGTGSNTYAYVVKDQIGSLLAANPAGTGARIPTNLSWQTGNNIGVIRADYVDAGTQTQPLGAGEDGSAFVVITDRPPADRFQYAGVLSSNPQLGAPAVYSASRGDIAPQPVPEPATILAWAGMAGAVALVRRVRKNRAA
ncbi:MAG: hypothetical protein SFX72_14935 [Isosphaeraceae bacterium]|nr:hypothetical protein [Isosphaeraceae bacterium]